MAEQPVVVQKISWSDLCPWILIFKTLPVASSTTVLAFALLGVVLSPIGWLLSETVFIGSEQHEQAPLMRIVESNRSPYHGVFRATETSAGSIDLIGIRFNGPQLVFHQLVDPFEALFSRRIGMREFCYFLFGSIWSVLVWSFAGLAITRVCLLRLTRNEHEGLSDTFKFARRYWVTAIGAIGIPLLAVTALVIPAAIIGLLMSFDVGVLIAGMLWIVVLVTATMIGLLLFGLMFGWPLMVASIGCECQNSFDAMTRSYAYTFQRPLHYFFYMLLAIFFGGFCWMIVGTLTSNIVDLSYWSASWGANVVSVDRMDMIEGNTLIPIDGAEPESGPLRGGRSLIGLWNGLLKTLAAAFVYGFFWCSASAIYLLLRRDVDEMEMDEIFVDEEKRTFSLPPLKSDENGIPQVQTPTPDDDASGADADSAGDPEGDGRLKPNQPNEPNSDE